jgi:hypothetical protein
VGFLGYAAFWEFVVWILELGFWDLRQGRLVIYGFAVTWD